MMRTHDQILGEVLELLRDVVRDWEYKKAR